MLGEREGLHPGGQVGGERDDGAPDLVLREVVQRQVGRAGVLGASDAVLGAGPAAVPQLEGGQLAAAYGARGDRGRLHAREGEGRSGRRSATASGASAGTAVPTATPTLSATDNTP